MSNPFGSTAQPTNPFAGLSGSSLDYLNATPSAGWGQYLNTFGLGSDAYSRWLKNQQSNYYNRYSGENAKNPNLQWTQYLQQINPQKEFAAMDPYSRGENPQAFGGRTRWSL